MKDDSNKPTDSAPRADELSLPADVVPESAAAKKKRKNAALKAAAAEIETRIGYLFKDPALLATAFTPRLGAEILRAQPRRQLPAPRISRRPCARLVVSDMLYRAFPSATKASCRNGSPISCARKPAPMWRARSAGSTASSSAALAPAPRAAAEIGARRHLRSGDRRHLLDGGYPAAEEFVQRNWVERNAQAGAPAARRQDGGCGMGAGQGPADAGVPRSRTFRPAPRSAFKVAVDVQGLARRKARAAASAPPRRPRRRR